MATNLSTYFRQQRLQLGLRPGQVASLMGYKSITGTANKIVMFEERGDIRADLFEKLKIALGIDDGTAERLIQEDQRAYIAAWWQWANQPVPWVVRRRDAPLFVPPWSVPEEITTQEEAEACARQFAIDNHAPVVYLSRRISVWIDCEGRITSRHEASPGEVTLPYMQLKGGAKFRFVPGNNGLSIETVQFPEQHGPVPLPTKQPEDRRPEATTQDQG
jgi:hypothetical protein